MKPILVTGALGSVGLPTVRQLLAAGLPVRILELPSPAHKLKHKREIPETEAVWGSISDPEICQTAVSGCRAVIHLAAVIPPQADREPETAYRVNVLGTAHLSAAAAREIPPCRFIYASSVAVYGDRISHPLIRVDDPLNPAPGDHYARQKISAEEIVRKNCPGGTIFRLSYIPAVKTLRFDPLMFAMPLETRLEICDPRDAAKALVAAAMAEERISWGQTYLLSGGGACRTTYRDYLAGILSLLGLGKKPLPDRLFSTGHFHCGFMDASETERLFHFQEHTLSDFLDTVRKKCRIRRFFLSLVRPLARRWLITLGESRI